MKKMFACVLALCPMIASADYLDDKIASLTKEKLDKIAKLEECQKSTKGLKIAGITTLGVSAIGIGANIGEAVKLNKLETQIDAADTKKSNLDKQISAAEEEKAKKEKAAEAEQERQAANNTCGDMTSCADTPNAESLNATDVVCINGVNKAKECKENFAGTQKSCKSNGITVTYYENCSANASTDKTCQEITQEWLTQNHVKSVECDKTTGQNYITACADTHTGETDENGRITGCKIKEQAQPAASDRAHHSVCEDAEKIDLQSKGADEVWVYKNKCVPKSCKTGWYLVVKGDSSQGYCVKSCPDYQKKSWTNGGQACDKLKPETVEVAREVVVEENQTECPEKSFVNVTPNNCENMCKGYAMTEKCKLVKTGTFMGSTCWCNPSSSITLDSQTNQSGNSALQTVPVQQNDSTTVVVQEVIQPIENNLPGRDMKGEVITYTTFYNKDNYDMLATITVDGTSYEAVAHVMAYAGDGGKAKATERAVKDKLKELGYSNYTLKKSN